MRTSLRIAALAGVFATLPLVNAAGLGRIRFVVTDPVTGRPTAGFVSVEDSRGHFAVVRSSTLHIGETPDVETFAWNGSPIDRSEATVITVPLGTEVSVTQKSQLPVKEITIRITATRLAPNRAPASTSATIRDNAELKKFGGGGGGNDSKQLTKGQAGVAEDSAGQAHVRGEHSEIAFVVDGVPLPDTLSGRQGSIVVTSTIQSLEMITGGFAPEFGGQTAAILNIQTLPGVDKPNVDYSLQGGGFGSQGGEITSQGPVGRKASYVIDINASQTKNAEEPPQPDRQTAHNLGSSRTVFTKFRFAQSSRDAFTLTLSNNPDATQIANRTGLPGSFAQAGQGYGLFGLRNADGSRPDAGNSPGSLGSAPIRLLSQQDAGQDINQDEISEFATLNYQRKVSKTDTAQIAVTLLHSGQDVTNRNPAVDPNNLPIDNSIEYNPEAFRNVHHFQASGSYGSRKGRHETKGGFLLDFQTGNESYHIDSASQLALDALAAIAPNLAPPGHASTQVDVNGYPIFTATGASPTLQVSRTGAYRAAYLQDTWKIGKVTLNYGLRGDWFNQNQNLGQPDIHTFELSPRANFEYQISRNTDLRFAYNHLFNAPPLAQGAVVGQAIKPETLDQYDVAVSHKFSPTQNATLAYYYKDIRNQVDTGLLIPGSQIGLYSAVNFDRGAVHGIEFSYNITAKKAVGWDAYLNYSYSTAAPNGNDNTGTPAPDFNDHDQRQTVGAGLAYTWGSGASGALTLEHGSGLASSVVAPDTNRTPRTEVDAHLGTSPRFFGGLGSLAVDISNILDDRTVINFQSGFSGTRFQQGRKVTVSLSGKF
jgi:outer membrane receptor protein involved in Fe transport